MTLVGHANVIAHFAIKANIKKSGGPFIITIATLFLHDMQFIMLTVYDSDNDAIM